MHALSAKKSPPSKNQASSTVSDKSTSRATSAATALPPPTTPTPSALTVPEVATKPAKDATTSVTGMVTPAIPPRLLALRSALTTRLGSHRTRDAYTCSCATSADFAEIAELRFQVFCRPLAKGRDTYRERALRNLLIRHAGGSVCLVAKKAMAGGTPGPVVGSLEITQQSFGMGNDTRVPGESFYMTEVAVYPEMRRQGIATALIDRAEQLAMDQGQVDTLSLHVDAKNVPARKTYLAAGFVETDETIYSRAFAYRLGLCTGALANVHHILMCRRVPRPKSSGEELVLQTPAASSSALACDASGSVDK